MEQSSERVSDWVAGQAPAHTQDGDWASSRMGAGRQTSVADGMGRGWVLRSRGIPGSAGVGGSWKRESAHARGPDPFAHHHQDDSAPPAGGGASEPAESAPGWDYRLFLAFSGP